MGVYIRGMEMPTRCDECRLSTVNSFNDRPLCDALVEYMSYGEWQAKRLDNCPLVPVPPHGGLIDLKAPFKAQYYDEMTEDWLEKIVTVEDVLYGCMVDEMPPTIIPAEEGE